jgi:hypothetical protein
MLFVAALWPAATELPGWTLGFGILLIVGGFMSCIIGMLYKIVPFLAWMHLQNQGQAKVMAPNMAKLLPEVDMQRQMWAWTASIALLVGAAVVPGWLARPAGLALAVACGWLWLNLVGAARRYRRHGQEIAIKLQAKA